MAGIVDCVKEVTSLATEALSGSVDTGEAVAPAVVTSGSGSVEECGVGARGQAAGGVECTRLTGETV